MLKNFVRDILMLYTKILILYILYIKNLSLSNTITIKRPYLYIVIFNL